MKPLALARAADRSAAFRALFPQLAVFPLRPIMKADNGIACTCASGAACGRIGKHPDCEWRLLEVAQKIGDGWTSHRDPTCGYGFGLATGARSGVFVVDLDGIDAIGAFTDLGDVPNTLTVLRDDEHVHLYFKMPDFAVRTSASDLAPKIDVRGDGGFVVSPGSPHKSGRTYDVAVDTLPADAPDWLLEWPGLRRVTYENAAAPVPVVPGSPEEVARIAEAIEHLKAAPPALAGRENEAGRRGHDTLWIVAQTLVRSIELPIETAYALIVEHYNPRCEPPWSEREIRHKLESARTRGRFTLRSEADAFNREMLAILNKGRR